MHPLVFLAMLFLLLICNPLVCASNDTKIAKFGSGMMKMLESV
jgi:hypothetical protein